MSICAVRSNTRKTRCTSNICVEGRQTDKNNSYVTSLLCFQRTVTFEMVSWTHAPCSFFSQQPDLNRIKTSSFIASLRMRKLTNVATTFFSLKASWWSVYAWPITETWWAVLWNLVLLVSCKNKTPFLKLSGAQRSSSYLLHECSPVYPQQWWRRAGSQVWCPLTKTCKSNTQESLGVDENSLINLSSFD